MKKSMIPIIIAIFGAILAVAGAIAQYTEKETSKRIAVAAKAEAAEFNSKLIQSQENLINAQLNAKIESDSANEEIIRLNNELVKKTSDLLVESERAKEIQQQTINFILGSKIAELSFYGKSPGVYAPVLYNSTEYPIYDLTVRIDDFDKIINCKSIVKGDIIYIGDDCVSKFSTHQGPYFIASGNRQKLTHKIEPSHSLIHLEMECNTRIGVVEYLCVLQVTTERMYYCIRVYNLLNGRKIFVSQKNSGLQFDDDDYWNKHFYADKKIYTGKMIGN